MRTNAGSCRLPRRVSFQLAAAASRPPLRAPLRDGFASLNPSPTRLELVPSRKDGEDQTHNTKTCDSWMTLGGTAESYARDASPTVRRFHSAATAGLCATPCATRAGLRHSVRSLPPLLALHRPQAGTR